MRRIQFSLITLLIIPLALSPILIAIRECRNVATHQRHELGVAAVLLGFLYVAALTFLDCSRRPLPTDRPWRRATLRGTIRGGLYGLLYYMLIFFPLSAADQYYIYWHLPWLERVSLFADALRSTILIGLLTGAPIGCAVGLLVGMFRRRMPHRFGRSS